MIRVLFVCHGNICRSTMAESVFTYMIKERGLENKFIIFSAGTSREEIGNPPHYGTVKKLEELNIPVVPHRATQITKKDLENYDYIIGMDEANIKNIEKIVGTKSEKIKKLLSFSGLDDDIADPWYTGDFDKTYKDIEKGLNDFLRKF
ncbi:low molecular weight protein-tyrosine-phosphatase [Fusobacterium russii]|uniref:low molecular weight protein-tyrosine-phosphatase n=1 Tax=Fusobacterium russii TaxID=854 RepID=UPI00039C2005|nr:low molecular weight protein-tyrosine-phosphatase [Fusobacterium russii]